MTDDGDSSWNTHIHTHSGVQRTTASLTHLPSEVCVVRACETVGVLVVSGGGYYHLASDIEL